LPNTRNLWIGKDYVILGTYRTIETGATSLNQIEKLIRVARDENWDLVPFIRGDKGFMDFAINIHHTNQSFKYAWYGLLQAMNYSESIIQAFDSHEVFYRNAYIVKPRVLDELIFFMQQAMSIVQTNETLGFLMKHDAKYISPTHSIHDTRVHLFVFERLPAFYLFNAGYKVCHTNSMGSCPCNFCCEKAEIAKKAQRKSGYIASSLRESDEKRELVAEYLKGLFPESPSENLPLKELLPTPPLDSRPSELAVTVVRACSFVSSIA
jgi:hypothetical protein